MLVKVDLGQKRLATLPISIVEKELMLRVEVDIGLRPSTLPHVIQVTMVYFLLYKFALIV